MTTKNLIIIIIILLLIAGGVFWYLSRDGADRGEEERGFFSRFFPGGGERVLTDEEKRRLEEGGREKVFKEEVAPTQTRQLVTENVSGAILVKDRIRYIERASGHVFEIELNGQNKKRISNTTIPGIFEVVWAADGERAILKYLSNGELNLLSARFVGSTTQGIFLPRDTKEVVFSPKGDRIAYVLPSGAETLIVTATPDNKNQTVRMRSPFSSWRLMWPDENNLFLLTASSAFQDGFLYRINLSTGVFEKILGPRRGLQASTDGRVVLFSETPAQGIITSSLLDLKTRGVRGLNIGMFPEKCVWLKKEASLLCAFSDSLPRQSYPDDWYKGLVSFSDRIVKINTSSISAPTISIPEGLDIIYPFLGKDESAVFFISKADGSLWGVNLK